MKEKHILLIYDYYKKIAATVHDHINAFSLYSNYKISLLPLKENKDIPLDLKYFDALIVHYSLFLFLDAHFSESMVEQIRNYQGLKIIFIQDEYRNINKIVERLSYMKFTEIFTCIPKNEVDKVYPEKKLPHLRKIQTLTGFVTEGLLNIKKTPYEERPWDVVYRARKLPATCGRLGQEKWQIAEKFLAGASDYPLNCNISYQESERIYGDKWIEFIRSAKATLGVESGSSLFDFTGEIEKKVKEHERLNPNATFDALEELYFKGLDGKIHINQISPRCFESAALHTLMILYEGDYSGILVPWRHYIPLKKNFSNMKEIVLAIQDKNLWEEITNNAYNEVALNPKYGYRQFIKNFDAEIDDSFKSSRHIALRFEDSIIQDAIRQQKRRIFWIGCKTFTIAALIHILRPIYRVYLGFLSEKNRNTLKLKVRNLFNFG